MAISIGSTKISCAIFDFNNTIALSDNGKATLFPNIKECIQILANHKVAQHIISNHKSRDEVINCLARFDLLGYFDQIICAGSQFAPKPNMEMYTELQNAVPDLPGVDVTLYIGDSPTDELFARNLGCNFIYIDELSRSLKTKPAQA